MLREMSELGHEHRRTAATRVTSGDGRASIADRTAAFANTDGPPSTPPAARALIDKVARNAWKVTDEDVTAAKSAGVTEDQLFELVVCAAMGQATRQIDSAMSALDEATKETAR